MQQEYDADELLVIEALRHLADRTDHDIMAEHTWSLAQDFADQLGIEIEEAESKLPYK